MRTPMRSSVVVVAMLTLVACGDDHFRRVRPMPGKVAGRACVTPLGILAGATVSIQTSKGERTATAGPDGKFVVSDIPDGYQLVRVTAPGIDSSYPVTVKAGDVAQVNFGDCDLAWTFEHTAQVCGNTTAASTKTLDLVFMVDTTGSMGDILHSIRDQLIGIMNAVKAQVPKAEFGLTYFEDFTDFEAGPNFPDRPYHMGQALTADTAAVRTAFNDLFDIFGNPRGGGGDVPESDIEALYQAATGEGFKDSNASHTVPPSALNWRSDSVKIIILVSDAAFRDPDDGDWAPPGAHGEKQAVTALNALGIKVMSFAARNELPYPTPEMQAIANETGAITTAGIDGDGDGKFTTFGEIPPGGPLVFQMDMKGRVYGITGSAILDAIKASLASIIVPSTLTVRAAGGAPLAMESTPPLITNVLPGTRACFEVHLSGEVPSGRDAEQQNITLEVVSDGNTVLESTVVSFTPSPPPGNDFD